MSVNSNAEVKTVPTPYGPVVLTTVALENGQTMTNWQGWVKLELDDEAKRVLHERSMLITRWLVAEGYMDVPK
jgi:hypothetical protein